MCLCVPDTNATYYRTSEDAICKKAQKAKRQIFLKIICSPQGPFASVLPKVCNFISHWPHWQFSPQDTTKRVPRFFTKEGKTYSGRKSKVTEFADFSLKIVGELREGPNEALGIRNKEGRWLVSITKDAIYNSFPAY